MERRKINFGNIEDLLDKSLLMNGIGGCGKTYTIKKTIPKLLKEGKKIGLIDFRNEYSEIVEKFKGLSINGNCFKEKSINNSLIHIHFNEDVYYSHKYNLDFLPSFTRGIDYLIVDDCNCLFLNHFKENKKDCLTISEICSSILKENEKIKFIFSLQSIDFIKEEIEDIEKLFPYKLLFRTVDYHWENYWKYAKFLEVGEALFYNNEEIISFFSFKEQKNEHSLRYLNEMLENHNNKKTTL